MVYLSYLDDCSQLIINTLLMGVLYGENLEDFKVANYTMIFSGNNKGMSFHIHFLFEEHLAQHS